MQKNSVIVVLVLIIVGGIGLFKKAQSRAAHKARFTVGIVQTASHPALDAARDGFVQQVSEAMAGDVAFVTRNGEGSIANLHTIAQQFHQDKTIDLVFAIATPAAQAVASVEHKKPVVIAAVTDPNALGVVHAETNVTGVNDMIDVAAQIQMITLLARAVRTVGILYNNGELNSVTLAGLMRRECSAHGLAATDFAISNEADLPVAAQMAFLKMDLVLAPTDNMVASSITFLSSLADKYKKPLIVSDNMLVAHGALAARGVDYAQSGQQAGCIAHAILVDGKKPHELPIEQAHADTIYLNNKKLSLLGLTVPNELRDHAVVVN